MKVVTKFGLCLLGILTASPVAAQFVVNDLYLVSNSLFSGGKGIVRIDPLTGTSSLLTPITNSSQSTLTYDPYRDRLIYTDSRTTGGIVAVDASGTLVDLAPSVTTPRFVAARGDGIIYFLESGLTATLRYLDASGVAHDVLDVPGTGSFTLSSTNLFDEIIYEPATHSLILMTGTFSGVPPPCTNAGRTCAVKIPLTASGTQVAGALSFTDVDVSSTPEIVVGSGIAPSGRVLIVVDTNSNAREPRMQLLDPVAMSMSTYASNGVPYGAAGTAAGTYSNARSQAIVLDYLSSVLRGFSFGDVGDGTIFASNLSGFLSRMVQIRPADVAGVDEPSPPTSRLRLEPMQPNPSTGPGLVRFTLAQSGEVRVTLQDPSGRVVRLLQSEGVAGPNSVWMDGRDSRGRSLAPGVYFVRLEAAGSSIMRKWTVLR